MINSRRKLLVIPAAIILLYQQTCPSVTPDPVRGSKKSVLDLQNRIFLAQFEVLCQR